MTLCAHTHPQSAQFHYSVWLVIRNQLAAVTAAASSSITMVWFLPDYQLPASSFLMF